MVFFEQIDKRGINAFEKSRAVQQLLSFQSERFGLAIAKCEAVQLLQLETQQIESRCPVFLRFSELLLLRCNRLPGTKAGCRALTQVLQVAKVIKQVPLHRAMRQRLMKMLAENIEQ